MIETSVSRQALLATKSYLLAALTSNHNSNLTTSDHIKFDTVSASSGPDISLDVSTTYTNSPGVASIGRFTLKSGKTYKLMGGVLNNSTGAIQMQWYNSTANAAIPGVKSYHIPATSGTNAGPQTTSIGILTPSVDTLVEFRIQGDITALSQFDAGLCWAFIESIEQVIPVRQAATGIAYLSERQANDTAAHAGATFTANTWSTRFLNKLSVEFDSNWISLSSNQFTIQPGIYRIWASSPSFFTGKHKIRLRNITSNSTQLDINGNTIVGAAIASDSTSDALNTFSIFNATFQISNAQTYEIQHICSVTRSGDGFGRSGKGGSNDTEQEIYTQVKIEKVG